MLVTLLVSHLGMAPNFGSSAHIPSTGFVLMHFSMASLNVSSVRNCVCSFALLLLFLLLSFLLAFPFSAQRAPFPDKEESTRRTSSSARRRERRKRRRLPEDDKEEEDPFPSFLEEEEEEEDASKR